MPSPVLEYAVVVKPYIRANPPVAMIPDFAAKYRSCPVARSMARKPRNCAVLQNEVGGVVLVEDVDVGEGQQPVVQGVQHEEAGLVRGEHRPRHRHAAERPQDDPPVSSRFHGVPR